MIVSRQVTTVILVALSFGLLAADYYAFPKRKEPKLDYTKISTQCYITLNFLSQVVCGLRWMNPLRRNARSIVYYLVYFISFWMVISWSQTKTTEVFISRLLEIILGTTIAIYIEPIRKEHAV